MALLKYSVQQIDKNMIAFDTVHQFTIVREFISFGIHCRYFGYLLNASVIFQTINAISISIVIGQIKSN